MDTYSSELQEIIAVIRREHRRTQIVFGISIIILALIIMFIAPAAIRQEVDPGNQDGSYASPLPQAPDATGTSTASSTPAP